MIKGDVCLTGADNDYSEIFDRGGHFGCVCNVMYVTVRRQYSSYQFREQSHGSPR